MHWLLPRLKGFERYHPLVEVLIAIADGEITLQKDGIDFAFRSEAQTAENALNHPLPNSGGMVLSYDKAALMQPLCHAFRDWVLAAAQQHRWPEP